MSATMNYRYKLFSPNKTQLDEAKDYYLKAEKMIAYHPEQMIKVIEAPIPLKNILARFVCG